MQPGRRLTAFATILAAVVLAAPPYAGADAGHNAVTVVNQVDGRTASTARAAVAFDPGPVVADENTAFAHASCTDCRTVAVALQVVAVGGSATDFEPVNAAVALNEDCTRCQTYAYARQEVIDVDGVVVLSDAGRAAVREIEAEADTVAASAEPFTEMGTELDGLAARLVAVVRSEIVQAGGHELGRTTHRAIDQRL